jgi:GT2 family glycosyltransferase
MPVFWASGACMMVRTKTFLENDGFETRFFAHMEEIDLCWRLWERGHEIWVEPASKVFHLGAGTLSKTSPRKTFLNYRNGLAMLFMNSSFSELFWKIPLRLILDGIASLRYARNGEFYNLVAISKAHVAFYREAGFWNKRRKENQKLRKATPPPSVYMQKSILPSYFLFGKKNFSQLEF